jgi:hypothetical protein
MIDAIFTALRLPAGGFQSAIVAPLVQHERMRTVGPFTMIAHALPVTLAPGALRVDDDVRPHPHIGIAALSYLFEGAMTHRDTLGVTQTIEPGDVNWMVAARGVVHSERYERLRNAGGRGGGDRAQLLPFPNWPNSCVRGGWHLRSIARGRCPWSVGSGALGLAVLFAGYPIGAGRSLRRA